MLRPWPLLVLRPAASASPCHSQRYDSARSATGYAALRFRGRSVCSVVAPPYLGAPTAGRGKNVECKVTRMTGLGGAYVGFGSLAPANDCYRRLRCTADVGRGCVKTRFRRFREYQPLPTTNESNTARSTSLSLPTSRFARSFSTVSAELRHTQTVEHGGFFATRYLRTAIAFVFSHCVLRSKRDVRASSVAIVVRSTSMPALSTSYEARRIWNEAL